MGGEFEKPDIFSTWRRRSPSGCAPLSCRWAPLVGGVCALFKKLSSPADTPEPPHLPPAGFPKCERWCHHSCRMGRKTKTIAQRGESISRSHFNFRNISFSRIFTGPTLTPLTRKFMQPCYAPQTHTGLRTHICPYLKL